VRVFGETLSQQVIKCQKLIKMPQVITGGFKKFLAWIIYKRLPGFNLNSGSKMRLIDFNSSIESCPTI
jgi:hypothetical protein